MDYNEHCFPDLFAISNKLLKLLYFFNKNKKIYFIFILVYTTNMSLFEFVLNNFTTITSIWIINLFLIFFLILVRDLTYNGHPIEIRFPIKTMIFIAIILGFLIFRSYQVKNVNITNIEIRQNKLSKVGINSEIVVWIAKEKNYGETGIVCQEQSKCYDQVIDYLKKWK